MFNVTDYSFDPPHVLSAHDRFDVALDQARNRTEIAGLGIGAGAFCGAHRFAVETEGGFTLDGKSIEPCLVWADGCEG